MPGRFSNRIWIVVALVLAVPGVWAWGQEYVPVSRSIDLPRGVKVDVHAPNQVRNDALAEVLEEYARKLRAETPPAPSFTNAALAAQTTQLSKSPEAVVDAPQPGAALPVDGAGANVESFGPEFTWGQKRITFLPYTLLWQPPLANPHEPRFYAKSTNLETSEFRQVADFSIGGTLALWRCAPIDRPDDGVQVDLFATTLSRFIKNDAMAALDYRVGFPITYARGPWSAKVSYEHTSTHLGDEFLLATGTRFRSATRDEFTGGLAYRVLEPLRVYGTLAYAAGLGSFVEDPNPMRYTVGAEWSRPLATGIFGQPFAALDVEFRGNEDFTPNLTAQLGWQWLAAYRRPGFRAALEFYDGRSPFGQLSDRHESWVGFGLFFDY